MLPHPSNHVWAQHCQGFSHGSSNTPGDICNALVHPIQVPHLSQPYLRAVPNCQVLSFTSLLCSCNALLGRPCIASMSTADAQKTA